MKRLQRLLIWSVLVPRVYSNYANVSKVMWSYLTDWTLQIRSCAEVVSPAEESERLAVTLIVLSAEGRTDPNMHVAKAVGCVNLSCLQYVCRDKTEATWVFFK